MLMQRPPVMKDLVLLGGGHSHIEVLRSFGMRPMDGVRVTLVTRDMHTPYSGMLPGYVSGFYSCDDCHIDLSRLSTFARARLIHEEATGIDIKKRHIKFRSRPPVAYDILSIDIGITPAQSAVPGASEFTTPVKPIDRFVARLDALLARCRSWQRPLALAVVGGGAGGLELALALQYRLDQERAAAGQPLEMRAQVRVFSKGEVLAGHPAAARAAVRAALARSNVQLLEGPAVARVLRNQLVLEDGGAHAFDECLWCTSAGAAAWLRHTGLATDAQGFLAINECLQSEAGPQEVFAAGDVASCARHPRPKAGVYAVRQGPPLAENLRRQLAGLPLVPFVPQSTALALISTGCRHAVASKGWLTLQGGWAWGWKDWIDRRFMAKYSSDLPLDKMQVGMASSSSTNSSSSSSSSSMSLGPEYAALAAAAAMRCGGCGAKVGASSLQRVLQRLQADMQPAAPPAPAPAATAAAAAVIGLAEADDAALLPPPPPGHLLVQSVDFFRSFWDDPYVFGRIAANHALGDVYAMGGSPASALALAVVPYAAEAQTEELLYQLMAGAAGVLCEAGCELVGGHSSEGGELALGFSVTGHVPQARVLRKRGLAPGDLLLLTKPVGTGTIMAAAMRGAAKGRWIAAALACMQQSSRQAAAILAEHGCSACTDVTGFGVLGHLVEMTKPSKVAATLDMAAIPVLPGARECVEKGMLSSLHAQNSKAGSLVVNMEEVLDKGSAQWPLLVDPQTAGGLLAGVPADKVAGCLAALREAGYAEAAVVGCVGEWDGSGGMVRVVV